VPFHKQVILEGAILGKLTQKQIFIPLFADFFFKKYTITFQKKALKKEGLHFRRYSKYPTPRVPT